MTIAGTSPSCKHMAAAEVYVEIIDAEKVAAFINLARRLEAEYVDQSDVAEAIRDILAGEA